jgi:hypothetical protein
MEKDSFDPPGSQYIHDTRPLRDNLILLPDGAILEPISRPSCTGDIFYKRIPEEKVINQRR